jgi:hypothetical protein
MVFRSAIASCAFFAFFSALACRTTGSTTGASVGQGAVRLPHENAVELDVIAHEPLDAIDDRVIPFVARVVGQIGRRQRANLLPVSPERRFAPVYFGQRDERNPAPLVVPGLR